MPEWRLPGSPTGRQSVAAVRNKGKDFEGRAAPLALLYRVDEMTSRRAAKRAESTMIREPFDGGGRRRIAILKDAAGG